MNTDKLYIAGYLQAMHDIKEKILANKWLGYIDKIGLLNDCDYLIGKCEQTTHIQEVSQGHI